MDLKHLSHLVALDDERHFARAAQRVHLSQPAFSRSIQAAEQALYRAKELGRDRVETLLSQQR